MNSLIDTHAHFNKYTTNNLNNEINEVNKINKNTNIKKIINVALDIDTSIEALKISQNNQSFYSTLGIHPLYKGDILELENLYYNNPNDKIVAIGETGIDTSKDILEQIEKFIDSITLANQLHLPLIIHANTTKTSTIDATKTCLDIIKKYPVEYGFVFHYFQPNLEYLKEILKLDGYISVGSNINKTNAQKSLEVVKYIPLTKLIIETDYPYMTKNLNTSLTNTFLKICELKNLSPNLANEQLNDNAYKLFRKLK